MESLTKQITLALKHQAGNRKILDSDTIVGKGAVIGSNVFITKSVPEGTKVSIKTPDLHFSGHETKKISMESFD